MRVSPLASKWDRPSTARWRRLSDVPFHRAIDLHAGGRLRRGSRGPALAWWKPSPRPDVAAVIRGAAGGAERRPPGGALPSSSMSACTTPDIPNTGVTITLFNF